MFSIIGFSPDGLASRRLAKTTGQRSRLAAATSPKTYPDTTSITYTYTGQKLTQVVDTTTNPDETHGFTYDASYRVATNTQGPRGTVTYTYTADDRPATMAIQSGSSSTYAYYPDGSLKTVDWSPVAGQFRWAYTPSGQYQSVTFPNGQIRAYGYDDQGRLLSLSNTLGATTLASFAYGYDVNNQTGQSTMLGQRTSLTATVPPQGLNNALSKYYYDSLYQLTKTDYPSGAPFNGEVDQWTYDAIGNRLTSTVNASTQTYAYDKNGANPLNGQRLSNDGVSSYTWDPNGSNVTRNGAPGNFTFGYDVDNRLASISGAATATYTYDYQGRRTSKTVSGVTTTYLYDGLNLIRETVAGTPADYAFGPGIDEPLAQYRSGTISYFAADGLGSVAVASSPSGTASLSTTFDAWGSTKSETGTRVQPFTYTGREVGEAGLLFYRARFLQTGTGRFTQEDPVGFRAGLNFFNYVRNRPASDVDPFGLIDFGSYRLQLCCRPLGGVLGFVSGGPSGQANHCYIRMTRNDTTSRTWSLMNRNGMAVPGVNHQEDLYWGGAKDCGESVCATPETFSCLNAATASYPILPYPRNAVGGPNSNTFALMVSDHCGGLPRPKSANEFNAPGWNPGMHRMDFSSPFNSGNPLGP